MDTLTLSAAVMYTCVTLSNVYCIVLVILLLAAGCASVTPILPHTPRALPERTLDECATQLDARRVTACSLFANLVELRHLTRLPVPDYTSHMASSFDRTSQHAAPGDAAWFANRDFATLDADRPELLLDVEGPGVVTRIWSANPSGILRIYLDGSDQPALEAPLLELLSGEFPPVDPAFSFLAASGGNLYLPIAFQRRCRITVTSSAKRLYYQVSYRRYAADVQVEPFSLAALSGRDSWAALAARELKSGAGPETTRPVQRSSFILSAADPGPNLTQPGGGVLRDLRLTPSTHDPEALRRSVLRIWVDGEETVRVPFGDFFGSGPGLQPVAALPLTSDPARNLLQSRWPMPFRHSLRLALETHAGAPLTAAGEALVEAQPFTPETLIFYARARAPEWHANEPTHEYTLTEITGDGVFAGTLLNVTNTEPAWWGEGDEKIWIDDEAFPSLFGTGTEDYFGYAYCSNERFSTPYIGQTLVGTRANYGRSSLYRFHVPDPVRFRKRLRFDLEVNHWSRSGQALAYDSVVFFYARPGARATASETAPFVPELNAPEPSDVAEGPYTCK